MGRLDKGITITVKTYGDPAPTKYRVTKTRMNTVMKTMDCQPMDTRLPMVTITPYDPDKTITIVDS